MRSILSRLAGRVLTGPIAFFLAGVLDILAFAATAFGTAAAERLGAARRRSARRRHRG